MSGYNYSILKSIHNTKVDKKPIWKRRIKQQTLFLHLLEDVFGTDISKESFGFYPNRIYFATSLTADPVYTKSMISVWHRIIKEIEKFDWEVYAPFDQSNPHSKTPDGLDSYQIRDLDEIQVMLDAVA